ncbi:shikimate kinase [Rhodococcus rhodnii]|uniref:Shikimate kinase n=2 Tax=Rhodococcus rhodnii TaxID=38312 RepID=R7WKV9_9NOCA|nr:shikimate kinase [Rhodococcus rhodnii]EOM75915.1 shikimate kinase [Rhodococcus rhodnii LMG 5362]TXG91075.1 shikimate kinase [Rhodococcus rhodnii]
MTPRAVIVGPPGAGKSTIGRRLANALGEPLLDTDAAIEARVGSSIPEFFAAHGEPAFRVIEEEEVARALAEHTGVVSLGGGAVLSERTRAALAGHVVVSLEISVAEGLRRTGASSGRPLLAGGDVGAKYRALMRRRRPLYREVATVRIRTDGRSPARVVAHLVDKLDRLGATPDRTQEGTDQ